MEDRTQELLTEAFAEYQGTYMRSQNWAPLTRRWYSQDVGELLAFLDAGGVTRGANLSIHQLDAFTADLERRGLQASSRQRKVVAVRVFLTFLYRASFIKQDLAPRVIPPQPEPKERRFLTQHEYERLLAACRYHARDIAIIEVVLQTGIRLAEVADLRLGDIELPKRVTHDPENTGSLTVTKGKGRKRRTLPLNWKVCSALKIYLGVRPPVPTDHIFISRFRNGMSRRAIQAVVEKYCDIAGIRDASVHTLRHTMATHHVMRGTSLPSVQHALGHANIKDTSIYVHMAKSQMRRELQEHAP